MKRALLASGIALITSLSAHAAPRSLPDLTVITDFQRSTDALTTEKLWVIDPDEANPHRQRWALSRKVEFSGLGSAKNASTGRFGIRAKGLVVKNRSFVRGPGPWFQELSAFDCTRASEPGFATVDGARLAADEAERSWEAAVDDEKTRLAVLLSRIAAPTSELAIKDAEDLLQAWYDDVSNEWRHNAVPEARKKEWAFYRSEAKTQGLCKSSSPRTVAKYRWENMMEPPAPLSETRPKILARAPARRWNGMFSVRVDVKIGTQRLVGQFLIDSSAPKSILSPNWLESQGILSPWVEVPRVPLEHAVFSGGTGGGLARPASVDGTELSGLPLPLTDFLLYETEFFGPPDNLAPCCDGVLGVDFLRHFVVEFKPGPPAEVVLWPREGFHPQFLNAPLWTEASLTAASQIVSDCELGGMEGTRWDTGVSGAILVHEPWRETLKKNTDAIQPLRCGSQILGERLSAIPAVPANDSTRGGGYFFAQREPAMTAGIGFLARDEFVFDLPHGRIWFPQRAVPLAARQNRSGLALSYDFVDGERVLFARKLMPRTPAQILLDAGLRPGMTITELDGQPAEDLDLWDVEQRLGGSRGNGVALGWMAHGKLKQATLKLAAAAAPSKGAPK